MQFFHYLKDKSDKLLEESGGSCIMTIAPRHAVYFLVFWFLANLFCLDRFPFVHSDEIWLGGLTRTMVQNESFAVTEPFFDLQTRKPHALKILFHAGQSLFLQLFGFTVFGLRFFSLVSGTIGLWLFYKLLRVTGISPGASLAGMIMLSLDSQFLYASHFGRQEILVAVFMFAGLLLFFGETRRPRFRAMCVGFCTGLALGVHPNAFIVAVPVSLLYVVTVLNRRRTIREGLVFVGAAALASLIFIFSSFMMNSDFLSNYSALGRSIGVRSGLAGRFADFPHFFFKLFERISGTYYTPDIRPQLLILFAATCIATGTAVWSLVKKRNYFISWTSAEKAGVVGIFGTGAGVFILGKFSQPSIVFLIPFLYICLTSLLSRSLVGERPFRYARMPIAILAVLLALFSLDGVIADARKETETYDDFQNNLTAFVLPGTRTLGNLSWGIPLQTENLVDIRNLAFLENAGQSLSEYIIKNKIECIIVSDELDFVYASRPVWNVLYGNPARWYPELRDFISVHCTLLGEFSSPGYGMRIVSRRYTRDWKVRVYRVADEEIVR